MRITEKGQVTIPKTLRERYGLRPGSEVKFVERDRRLVLEKAVGQDAWEKYYGCLKLPKGTRTDALIKTLRGPRP